MGYKMPIVCKELYLPMPDKSMTLKEYKSCYGVDLTPFIKLEDNYITLNFPFFTKLYLVSLPETENAGDAILGSKVFMPNDSDFQAYVSESDDAITTLALYNTISEIYKGIKFVIPAVEAFEIDNILVISIVN